MYVETVSLKQFRNYDSLHVSLLNGVNVFYGANAQGKTNFLESVYLCSTGRSKRTHLDKELIQFGESNAHVQLLVRNESSYDRIDVHIKKEDKKGIAVNGIPIKRLGELFGTLLTVIFSPEDLSLIKAGPAERRKFMDVELCQLSGVYYYELQQYYHILKQRNNLLKTIRDKKDNALKETLFIWDEQLAEHGVKIIDYRTSFIENINEISGDIHARLTDSKEKLTLQYKPNVPRDEFLDKLTRTHEKDIYQAQTLAGIHKDDIVFYINGVDAKTFGSQGQQRTAAISAKLAEIELIKSKKRESPVLLLDDVLSELDESRQKYFLSKLYDIQTIITCTGVESVLNEVKNKVNIYHVENGKILLK